MVGRDDKRGRRFRNAAGPRVIRLLPPPFATALLRLAVVAAREAGVAPAALRADRGARALLLDRGAEARAPRERLDAHRLALLRARHDALDRALPGAEERAEPRRGVVVEPPQRRASQLVDRNDPLARAAAAWRRPGRSARWVEVGESRDVAVHATHALQNVDVRPAAVARAVAFGEAASGRRGSSVRRGRRRQLVPHVAREEQREDGDRLAHPRLVGEDAAARWREKLRARRGRVRLETLSSDEIAPTPPAWRVDPRAALATAARFAAAHPREAADLVVPQRQAQPRNDVRLPTPVVARPRDTAKRGKVHGREDRKEAVRAQVNVLDERRESGQERRSLRVGRVDGRILRPQRPRLRVQLRERPRRQRVSFLHRNILVT